MRSITQVNPADAARIRAYISTNGKLPPVLTALEDKPVKTPKLDKKKVGRRPTVECVRRDGAGYIEIEVPVVWDRAMYNVGQAFWMKDALRRAHRDAVWSTCLTYLADLSRNVEKRSGIKKLELVRLAPVDIKGKRDNLPASFKYVLDALCAFLLWGADCINHKKDIGDADDILDERGLEWTYYQQRSDISNKLHGLRIRLWLSEASS